MKHKKEKDFKKFINDVEGNKIATDKIIGFWSDVGEDGRWFLYCRDNTNTRILIAMNFTSFEESENFLQKLFEE